MEREPLCSVSYCPAPTDPDAHQCPHCKGIVVEHQHVVPRGMGGSPSRRDDPRNVVMICPALHRDITEGRMSDGFVDVLGERIYRVWDIHNNTVAEYRPYWIQPNGSGPAAGLGSTLPATAGPLAPVDAADLDALLRPLPPGLPYELWYEIGVALGRVRDKVQWAIAEWVQYGDREYGEKYSQAVDVTGYTKETLMVMASTAAAYTNLTAQLDCHALDFSVAKALAPIAREGTQEGRETVERAIAEGWTETQAKDAVRALRAPDGYEEPEQHECPECGHRHRRKA